MRDTTGDSLADGRFSVDTTFVLFFLAMDLGQSAMFSFGLDTMFSGLTLAILLVVPYFLPTTAERPDFTRWLAGRSLVSTFAIGLGMMFSQGLGVVLPEMFRYLPMTMLILTAMVSCYLQFYAMITFRLAR